VDRRPRPALVLGTRHSSAKAYIEKPATVREDVIWAPPGQVDSIVATHMMPTCRRNRVPICSPGGEGMIVRKALIIPGTAQPCYPASGELQLCVTAAAVSGVKSDTGRPGNLRGNSL
jgi:hypothetical protein